MQNPSTPNAFLPLLRRLAKAAAIKRFFRRGDSPSRIDGIPRCGGYNELFVASRGDRLSTKS